MITVSYLFDNEDMRLLEDWTAYCIKKYGTPFLESLLPFFEGGDTTIMEQYYEESGEILFEAQADLRAGGIRYTRAKQLASKNRKDVKSYKHNSLFKKATEGLSKNQIGRSIIKNVKKLAYNTAPGRKLMGAYAKYRDLKGGLIQKGANRVEKEGLLGAHRAGLKGKTKSGLSDDLIKASGYMAKKAKTNTSSAAYIRKKVLRAKNTKIRGHKPRT